MPVLLRTQFTYKLVLRTLPPLGCSIASQVTFSFLSLPCLAAVFGQCAIPSYPQSPSASPIHQSSLMSFAAWVSRSGHPPPPPFRCASLPSLSLPFLGTRRAYLATRALVFLIRFFQPRISLASVTLLCRGPGFRSPAAEVIKVPSPKNRAHPRGLVAPFAPQNFLSPSLSFHLATHPTSTDFSHQACKTHLDYFLFLVSASRKYHFSIRQILPD